MVRMLVRCQHVFGQPGAHLLAIRCSGFTEAQVGASLGSVLRTRVPLPGVQTPEGRFQVELVRHIINDGSGHLVFPGWEAACVLKNT